MANLSQRLRYSYGGYEEVPEQDDGLVEHHVRFDMTHKDGAFARAMEDIELPMRQLQSPTLARTLVMLATGNIPSPPP